MLVVSNLHIFSHQHEKPEFFLCFAICLGGDEEEEIKLKRRRFPCFHILICSFFFFSLSQEELLNELKGRKEAIKDQKLIKREALTDGTMETLLDGKDE